MQLENFKWPERDEPDYDKKLHSIIEYLKDRCLPKFHKDLSLRATIIARNIEVDYYNSRGDIVKDHGALLGAIWSALYAQEMKGE